ncbi:hypothetical protein TSOC_002208 [Tetrabaena socialis]|uniref:Uncharacterized protein n=1 Tax=Tetrabaena socialis TaxID=47790 RepID=A0A2J8AEQ7_9CHLO|nr:hypothetical protein TSOC_002208 [Tetrabaena socialis]|eukprot:PNH10989.1 hypothetical protein TSOC_002208 [Tetrabaena socialis]
MGRKKPQALSPMQLRRMSSFTALPPPEGLDLQGEDSYRYVRQDTQLWSALHAGRLTTSRLKDALGLRDLTASRLVGGPQFPQLGVAMAYAHLQTPRWDLPARPSAGAAAAPGWDAGAPASASSALLSCEAARLLYNELLASGSGEEAGSGEGWSAEDRRRNSEAAALSAGSANSVRMRLLWGTLQESSAVATLALLFPGSQVEEVGLLCLSDPRPWGVEQKELPPLGASPDALITHHVAITRHAVEAARAQLSAGGGGGAASHPAAARTAARAVLRAALELHTKQAGAAWAAQRAGATSPAGQAARHPPPEGLTASYFAQRSIPLYGAAEEALEWLTQELLAPVRRGSAAQLQGDGQQLQLQEGSSCGDGGGGGCTAGGLQGAQGSAGDAGSGQGGSGDDGEVAAVVRLREVVEVKNHCPFVFKGQRAAQRRGVTINYANNDRGPVASLWPLWVPQLQAHCASCGADSVLLLSRSPSKGIRLFRMYRDDEYLSSALALVRELQCAHVARNEPPGADPWAGRPGYDELLQRTVALARQAEAVIEAKVTPKMDGADSSAFWSLR